MDLSVALHKIWQRKLWLVPIAVLAAVGALAINYDVEPGLPPKLNDKHRSIGAAQTAVLLDSPQSTLADLDAPITPLAQRAEVYAQFLQSQQMREAIAKETNLPPNTIQLQGQRGGQLPVPGSAQRANELILDSAGRRVFFRSEQGSPIISIFTQGSSAEEAVLLANGAARGTAAYVAQLQEKQRIPTPRRVRIRQLGEAQGGRINKAEVGKILLVLTAAGLFVFGSLLLLGFINVLHGFQRARLEDPESSVAPTPEPLMTLEDPEWSTAPTPQR